MELITSDIDTVTVRFARDEYRAIDKILMSVFEEYKSLDPEIIEVPKELVSRLSDDFHAVLEKVIYNTNRALQSQSR